MSFLDDARAWLIDDIEKAIAQFEAMAEQDRMTKKKAMAFFEDVMQPAKDHALRAALAEVGLDIPSGPVNQETVTEAINEQYLSELDIALTNIFDKRELRAALERVAIAKVADQLGLALKSNTVDGVKEAIIDSLSDVIGEQLASEAGEIFEAAIPAVNISNFIRAAMKEPRGFHTNIAVNMSDKAQQNRDKQARYRAKNKREWRIKKGVIA